MTETTKKTDFKSDQQMRLGMFRAKTRDLDNKLFIRLSDYDDGRCYAVEIDFVSDNEIFLRKMEEV